MIKIKNLQKNYGLLTVLSNINFSLEKGQKIALTGKNGVGKSTLLKILAGIEKQDSGKIEKSRNICIGYLPQDMSFTDDISILDYLKDISGIGILEEKIGELSTNLSSIEKKSCYSKILSEYENLHGYTFIYKAKNILSGFGLENIDVNQSFSDLSSGQKSKVALTGILLKGVDLLLLDEPTNNLDLPALIWLENFLQKSEATCLIVSHDRRFLDRVARKIFEIDSNTHSINISNGTYSNYLNLITKRLKSQEENYQSQQKEIGRLKNRIREKKQSAITGSKWSGKDNDKYVKNFKQDKSAKSSKVAKSIEKRIEQMDEIDRPLKKKIFEIPLETKYLQGKLNIFLNNVTVGYDGSFQFGPFSLEINYGDRVGIMGLNGSGKSTLLKSIAGEIPILGGDIEIGSGVKLGNMMQEHQTLPYKKSLLEFLEKRCELSREDAYNKLCKFGFDEKQADLPIKNLSPGGRARLLLALFSAQFVNTLILDEPTNHLDIEALETLEKTLESYQGTILLVSHDRHFIEKINLQNTFVLSNSKLKTISDYKEYIEIAEKRAQKLLKSF